VESGTQEEEIILNDKFLTQSSLDIHRKLKKLVTEPGKSLDQLVQVATTLFYIRGLERERRKDKCRKALIRAMWVTPLGAGLNLLTSSLFQPQQYPYLRGQEGAQQ
jgi:hypothetical protein